MGLKILVCDQVKFANINAIESIIDNVVTFYGDNDWISLSTKRAELTESLKRTNSGSYIGQIMTFASRADSDTLNLIKKPSVYLITLQDGAQFVWGSLDLPVRCSLLNDVIGASSGELNRKALYYEFRQ